MTYKILQIGYGNMGSAIADAIAKNKQYEFHIIDPNQDKSKRQNISFYGDISEFKPIKVDVVIIAVKPQNISAAIEEYQEIIPDQAIIISILAGTKLSYFKEIFPTNPIVKLMPNLAAKILKSTSLAYSKDLDEAAHKTITDMFSSFGEVIWLDNEDQFHSGTAVAGSGPAYYFLLFQYFVNFLEQEGFSSESALEIVTKTAQSSAELASQEGDLIELTKKVASKGGTTEAALEIFEQDGGLAVLVSRALNAAAKRSKTF